MDKKLQKELRDSSRVFNGYWARLLKFGPEDKQDEFLEVTKDLMNTLQKVLDDTVKRQVGDKHA